LAWPVSNSEGRLLMNRQIAVLLLATYVALVTLITAAVSAAGDKATQAQRVIGHGQIRFAGAGPELWALRYRRQRRVARTFARELASRLDRVVWLVDAFQCIHRYEGSWTANTGNGYRGGLQMGTSEWSRYGAGFAPRADQATPAEQIAAAIAYHDQAGFGPWPQTSRMCGLR
jgi:hypothetical protein